MVSQVNHNLCTVISASTFYLIPQLSANAVIVLIPPPPPLVIGIGHTASCPSAVIAELAKDSKWRVRVAIILVEHFVSS